MPSSYSEVYTSENGLSVSARDAQMCLGSLWDVYRFMILLPHPLGASTTQPPLPPTFELQTKVTSLFETAIMGDGEHLHNPSWKAWGRPALDPAKESASSEYTDPWLIWCDVEYDISKVEVHTGYRGAGPWMLKYRTAPNKANPPKPRSASLVSQTSPSARPSASLQRQYSKDSSRRSLGRACAMQDDRRKSSASGSSKNSINRVGKMFGPPNTADKVKQEGASSKVQQKKRNWNVGRLWKRG